MVWGLAGTLMNKAMDTDGVLSEGRVWEEGGRCDQILFSPIPGRKSQANNV